MGHQFITPKDIEDVTGLTEGNIFQGELSLEQLFFNRPVPGWARYRDPDPGPVDVRVGDASRWRDHGRPRPDRRARGAEGPWRARGQDEEGGLSVGARSDVVVIGAGHNGLVAAALLAKAGVVSRSWSGPPRSGGILRGASSLLVSRPPGSRTRSAVSVRSVVEDLRLEEHGSRRSRLPSDVRAAAGRILRDVLGRCRQNGGELRERNPRDADAYAEFDQKVRAIASFLAYVNVATPPDISAPTLADAISGLKVGWAFRGLGARYGREAIRMMPMAVADLVQEVFEEEAVRGPLSTRGVLYTACGPWSSGTAALFLNDSAGNDGGAAGTAVFARGGTQALATALASAASAAARRSARERT